MNSNHHGVNLDNYGFREAMSSIPYAPFDGPTDIRLVEVQPGFPDASLQCQIVHASVDDSDSYEALSYTWGKPSDGFKQVYISGQSVQIAINLHHALKALRPESGRSRRIWIDSLCINQRDEEERSHHVQRMGEIYRRAKTVIIWLGKEYGNSGLAMSAMAKISSLHTTPVPMPGRLVRDYKRYRAAWTAIGRLFGRDYWQRMWIVQEVQLASVLRVHCGAKSVGWEVLQHTLELANTCLECHELSKEKVLLDVANSLAARLEAHRLKRQSHGSTLKELLHDCRNSLCSDQRDIVYALVGLACDCQNGELVVDYTKSVSQIYRDVMKLYTFHGYGDWHSFDGRDACKFSKFLQGLLQNTIDRLPISGPTFNDPETVLIAGFWAGTIDNQRQTYGKTLSVLVTQNSHVFNISDDMFTAVIRRLPILADFHPPTPKITVKLDDIDSSMPQHVFLDNGQPAVVSSEAMKGDMVCQFMGHETALVFRLLGSSQHKIVGTAILFRSETSLSPGREEVLQVHVLEDIPDESFRARHAVFIRLGISTLQVLTS